MIFFVDNKYFIEYDGETHYDINLHGWHTKEAVQKQQKRDKIKNNYCKEHHIPLIRIPYIHYNDLKIEDLLLETSTFIIEGDKMKIQTKFITMKDVTDFVEMANRSRSDIWVTKANSRICVDAKSLMGMFSIDTSTDFIIETDDDEIADYILTVYPDVSKYID